MPAASLRGGRLGLAGSGGPGPLTRSVRFATARPLLAGTAAAVLVAGGLTAVLPRLVMPGGATSGTNPVGVGGAGIAWQPSIDAPPAGPDAGAQPGPAFVNTVPRVPAVTSATELGPVRQHPRVSARDNGQSVAYENRSVWVFADTVFRNPFGLLSNSGAVTTDLTAGDGLVLTSNNPFTVDTTTDPVEVIPRNEAERRFEAAHSASTGCTPATDPFCRAEFAFWPGPMVADPARGRILMFYSKLCRGAQFGTTCSGLLGKPLGSGVAVLDMRTRRVTRVVAAGRAAVASVEGPDPTLFFGPGSEFSAAALAVDGMVYVYGGCTYQGCKLGRVGLGEVADRSRWAFFTGRDRRGTDRWSGEPADAVNTVVAGGAGQTVLWVPALRCFLNVLLPYGSNRALFQVGGSPFGPWSAPRPLADTEPGGTAPNYALFGHAEYAEQDGLMQYVSYFQPATGQLRLVRVTFAAAQVGQ